MCGVSHKASRIAAFVIITFNLVGMILCLIVFALSIWAIASPTTMMQATQLIGSHALDALVKDYTESIQVIISGALLSVFVFFIASMGLYGAIVGSQFLLFMYATLVILLMLLEFALMYYFSSNIIEKGLQGDNIFDNALRVSFHCCDKNYTLSEAAPWSCCGFIHQNCTAEFIFTNDCKKAVSSWLNNYQLIIYIAVAVLHIVLCSCSLLRRCNVASHSYT